MLDCLRHYLCDRFLLPAQMDRKIGEWIEENYPEIYTYQRNEYVDDSAVFMWRYYPVTCLPGDDNPAGCKSVR